MRWVVAKIVANLMQQRWTDFRARSTRLLFCSGSRSLLAALGFALLAGPALAQNNTAVSTPSAARSASSGLLAASQGAPGKPYFVSDSASLKSLPAEAKPLLPALTQIVNAQEDMLKNQETRELAALAVKVAQGLRSKEDLEWIETGLSEQKPVPFKSLIGHERIYLSGEQLNYVPAMKRLYGLGTTEKADFSWKKHWLPTGQKIAYTPTELEAISQQAIRDAAKYAKKPNDWSTQEKAGTLAAEVFTFYEYLFNSAMSAIPEGVQSQGLLLAYDRAIKEILDLGMKIPKNDGKTPDAASYVTPEFAFHLGIVILASQPEAKIVVVEQGALKYAQVSDQQIDRSALGTLAAQYGERGQQLVASLKKLNQEAGQKFVSTAVTKLRFDSAKAMTKQLQSDIAAAEARTAYQQDRLYKFNRAGTLRDEIVALIKQSDSDDRRVQALVAEKLNELIKIRDSLSDPSDRAAVASQVSLVVAFFESKFKKSPLGTR